MVSVCGGHTMCVAAAASVAGGAASVRPSTIVSGDAVVGITNAAIADPIATLLTQNSMYRGAQAQPSSLHSITAAALVLPQPTAAAMVVVVTPSAVGVARCHGYGRGRPCRRCD